VKSSMALVREFNDLLGIDTLLVLTDRSKVISKLREQKQTAIVVDYGEKMVEATTKDRNTFLFNPTINSNQVDQNMMKYNPLSEVRLKTRFEYDDVCQIAEVIMSGQEIQNVIVREIARDLLIMVILHLCYVSDFYNKKRPNICDIENHLFRTNMNIADAIDSWGKCIHISKDEFLSDKNIFEQVYGEYIDGLSQIKQNLKIIQAEDKIKPFLTHPQIKSISRILLNFPDYRCSEALLVIKRCLEPYCNSKVIRNMDESNFEMDDIVSSNKGKTVYLIVEPWETKNSLPVIKMFLEQAIKRHKMMKSSRENLLLVFNSGDIKDDINEFVCI